MFTWLAYNTLCALPIAAVALLLRRWKRVTPGFEHFLWLLVLVRLILPPLSFGGAASSALAPVISSGPPSLGDVLVARTTRVLGTNWSTWATAVCLVLFLLALVFVALRELVRARAVERCVRRSRTAGAVLENQVKRVAGRLGVRAPRVRVSAEAAGPFLWSARRPVLVLPAAEGRPAPTVLAHELAHLERRDHWTAWLELVAQALHFWNPLFWLARRRLRVAAELACDRWVVARFPRQRRAFAAALIDTAERAAGGAFLPRAVQALGSDWNGGDASAGDGRDFEERLVHILHGEARTGAGRGLPAACVVLAALTLPGLAAPTLGEFRAALPVLPAGIDTETWRASLVGAEERLRVAPDDGEALRQRGMALLGLDRFDEAVATFQHQAARGFRVANALYNEACAHARAGASEPALDCLVRAAELDPAIPGYARADHDLDGLRAQPEFAQWLAAQP